MTTKCDNQNTDSSIKSSWYQAAKGVTLVAGIFSIIILGLLVFNYLQQELLDPMRAERLENLKIKLLDQPKNNQLINTIRELDLQLREDKFYRHQFSQRGGLLLFGTIAIFIIGIKTVKAFKENAKLIPGYEVQAMTDRVRLTINGRLIAEKI